MIIRSNKGLWQSKHDIWPQQAFSPQGFSSSISFNAVRLNYLKTILDKENRWDYCLKLMSQSIKKGKNESKLDENVKHVFLPNMRNFRIFTPFSPPFSWEKLITYWLKWEFCREMHKIWMKNNRPNISTKICLWSYKNQRDLRWKWIFFRQETDFFLKSIWVLRWWWF